MGCADPPPLLRGSVHPISVLELKEQRSGGGGVVTSLAKPVIPKGSA